MGLADFVPDLRFFKGDCYIHGIMEGEFMLRKVREAGGAPPFEMINVI
jgi:hypothetical protein